MVLLPLVSKDNKDPGFGFSLYITPVVERIIGDRCQAATPAEI